MLMTNEHIKGIINFVNKYNNILFLDIINCNILIPNKNKNIPNGILKLLWHENGFDIYYLPDIHRVYENRKEIKELSNINIKTTLPIITFNKKFFGYFNEVRAIWNLLTNRSVDLSDTFSKIGMNIGVPLAFKLDDNRLFIIPSVFPNLLDSFKFCLYIRYCEYKRTIVPMNKDVVNFVKNVLRGEIK